MNFDTLLELQTKLSEKLGDNDIDGLIDFILINNFFDTDNKIYELLKSFSSAFCANNISADHLSALLQCFYEPLQLFFIKKKLQKYFIVEYEKYFILLLLENKIITELNNLNNVESCVMQYFAPELGFNIRENTINEFVEKRKYGENPDQICQAVREDNIDQFIDLIAHSSINLNDKITPSVFEKNYLLNKEKNFLYYINYAAFYGALKVFKYLIMSKVLIPNNLLDFAFVGGNANIIHICEEMKETKVLFNNHNLKTCLNWTILYHNNEIIEYILNNYEMKLSLISFDYSLMSFNCHIIRQYIQSFFSQIDTQESIFKQAVVKGFLSIFLYLIKDEGNRELIDKNIFCNLLFFMINRKKYDMFIESLSFLQNEANHLPSFKGFDFYEYINEINENHNNLRLVDYSIKYDLNCFKVLCQIDGVDLNENIKTKEEAPIIKIIKTNKNDLFQLLMQRHERYINYLDQNDLFYEIDFVVENNVGETPYHIACQKGNIEIVLALSDIIGYSFDVNRQTNNGETALHCAVRSGSIDIVRFLVEEMGANKTLKDNKKKTPQDIASQLGFIEINMYLSGRKNIMVKPPINFAKNNKKTNKSKNKNKFRFIY